MNANTRNFTDNVGVLSLVMLVNIECVNSSRPIDANMLKETRPSLIQFMTVLLFNTKLFQQRWFIAMCSAQHIQT